MTKKHLKELTEEQRDEICVQYAQIVVDRMDVYELEEFVKEALVDDYLRMNDDSLEGWIKEDDEQLYADLVDTQTETRYQVR